MVTNKQVNKLFECFELGWSLCAAAARTGMSEKTARHYRAEWKLPSQLKKDRHWRTREDPFERVWKELQDKLELAPGLQAKTLMRWLADEHPGEFQQGQLRTLQRRIKCWHASAGPAKEVFFPQIHHPGKRSQSDFTHMTELKVTIAGQLFEHLCFHFVFTYSNWEDATVCYSESYESLSFGLQNAWFRAGGVATDHQTDRMTAAVNKDVNPERFTASYRALLSYYRTNPKAIQARKANEDGDVEQSHNRFKEEVNQELLLRGCRDFGTLVEYEAFLRKVLDRRNAQRSVRFEEERAQLKPLPERKLDDSKRFDVRVSRSSTILIQHNTYSVHSRLIGEWVQVRIYAERLDVWYAGKVVDSPARLRGTGKHHVQYRHIIDWLVRKPGAFEDYLYKVDLFPTSYFRMAYDQLTESSPARASKCYLEILKLAASESETQVNDILRELISGQQTVTTDLIKQRMKDGNAIPPATEVTVEEVNLGIYDSLLENQIGVVNEHYFESSTFIGT